jgi:hypothetical protein
MVLATQPNEQRYDASPVVPLPSPAEWMFGSGVLTGEMSSMLALSTSCSLARSRWILSSVDAGGGPEMDP